MIKHSIIYFLGKFIPAIVSIISIVVFTRLIEPEIYGTYSLIITVIGLINILLFQWIRSSLLRFFNEKNNFESFYGSIINAHIIVFLIVIGLVICVINFSILEDENYIYVYLGLIILFLLSFYELLSTYFRSALKPLEIVFNNTIKSIVVLSSSVFYLIIGYNNGLLFGMATGLTVGMLLYIIKLNKSKIRKNIGVSSRNTIKQMFIYGAPITLSFALSAGMQNIDKIMISMILGVEANGNFAVSYDFTFNTMFMVLMSLSMASFPLILKTLKENGLPQATSQFEQYIQLFLFILFPLAAGFFFISKNLLNLIIGDDYNISSTLTFYIILATIFQGLKSFWFDQILQISAETKSFYMPVLIALIVNIIANLILLKKFGIEGAAIATAIGFFVAMILSYNYSKNHFVVKIRKSELAKLATNTSLMYLIISQIYISNVYLEILIQVTAGILIYTMLSVITNVFNIKYYLKKLKKSNSYKV